MNQIFIEKKVIEIFYLKKKKNELNNELNLI